MGAREGGKKSRRLRKKHEEEEGGEVRGGEMEIMGEDQRRAEWWEWKKQAAETAERERGYIRQQAKGVQVLMTLIIIGAVQGGEREGEPLGYMKGGGGSGEQIEEKEESGVRPVGLSNIKNNCNGKKTHGGDYGYVTGTSFGDGGRRCAGDPGPFAWTRKVRRTGLALGVPVWHERLREKQTRSGETRGNGESRGEGKL
jgi:hypothetical protein